MANKKITQLEIGVPLATDVFPYVDLISNTTKKSLISSVGGFSLNGLTGVVTISAGTNISFNTVGNNIEINSIGDGGSPASPNTSIQFNNSGSFGGTSNVTLALDASGSGYSNITLNSRLVLGDNANNAVVSGEASTLSTNDGVAGVSDGINLLIVAGAGAIDTGAGLIKIQAGDSNFLETSAGYVEIKPGNNNPWGGNGAYFKLFGGKDSGDGGDVTLNSGESFISDSGSTLITNGSFSGSAAGWTLGANWAYGSNHVTHTPGATATLSQNIAVLDGQTYHVSLNVGGTTGSVDISLGDNPPDTKNIIAGLNGNFYITAGVISTGNIVITPSSDFDGTIDNVNVKLTPLSASPNGGGITIFAGDSNTNKGGSIDIYTEGGLNGEGSGIEMLMQPGTAPTLSFYAGDFIADGLGGIDLIAGSPRSGYADNVTPGPINILGGDSSAIPNGNGGDINITAGAKGVVGNNGSILASTAGGAYINIPGNPSFPITLGANVVLDGGDLNVLGGGVSTGTTAGFLIITYCAGTPTGTPTSGTGAMMYDTVAHKLWIYDGGWKFATFT